MTLPPPKGAETADSSKGASGAEVGGLEIEAEVTGSAVEPHVASDDFSASFQSAPAGPSVLPAAPSSAVRGGSSSSSGVDFLSQTLGEFGLVNAPASVPQAGLSAVPSPTGRAGSTDLFGEAVVQRHDYPPK